MPYQITDEMRAFRKRSNRTYLFTMDPRDFLRLTTHEDLLSMDEVLKDAKPLAFYNSLSANDPDTYNGDIYFDIELNSTGTVGKVFNHEGRHRCGALINAGEQTVEVSARFVKVDHENYDVKTITPRKPIKKLVSQFAKGFNAPADKTVMMSAIRVSRTRRRLRRRNPAPDVRLQEILRTTRQEPVEDNFRALIIEAQRQGQRVLVLTTNERTHKDATHALTHVKTDHVVHLVSAGPGILNAKLTNPRAKPGEGLDILGQASWNYAGSFYPKLLTILGIKLVAAESIETSAEERENSFERHSANAALAAFGLNEYGDPERRNPDEPRGVPEHIYFKKGSKTVCTSAVLAAFGIDSCSYHYSGKLQQRLNILRKNGYAARSRNSHIARGYKKLRIKRGEKSVGQVRRIIARLNKDNPETNAWGDPHGTRYMIRVLGHALLLDYHGNTIVDTDPRIRDKRKVLDLRAVFRKPEIESSRRYLRRRNPASLEKLEKIAKARMLYAQQDEKNISEIAEELDVGWNTVQKWIQDIAEPSKSVFIADVEDEVERLYNLGDKNSGDLTIARAVGVNRATIARWRKKRGLPPGKNWKIDQRVRELYAEHGNIGTVGKILGISPSTVYNKVKDLAKKKKRTDRKQQLYDQGFTDRQIADEMGLSKTTIASWRHVRNLPPNDPPLEEWEENIAELQTEAARLYKELGSAKKVAKQLGISYHHVKKWLRDIEYVDPRVAEVKRIYRETGNFREITRRTGVGYRTAKRWVTPRRYLRRRNPSLEKLEQISRARKLYQETGSIRAVARQMGMHFETVRPWLEDLLPRTPIGIEPRIVKARKVYQETGSIRKATAAVKADPKNVRKWVDDLIPGHPIGIDPKIIAARKAYKQTGSLRKTVKAVGSHDKRVKRWVEDLIPKGRKFTRYSAEDRTKVLELCDKGLSFVEIARRTGVGRVTVATWCQEVRRNPEDLETLELIAEARKLYTDNQHIAKTAHILGVSQKKVQQWVQDLRPHTGRWADLSKEQAHAKKLYQACDDSIMSRGRISKNKLGQVVGVSLPTIRKWINAGELGPDPGCNIEARVLPLYNLGHTDTEIANQLGVSRNQVKLVRHAKLQLPPNRMSDRYAEGLVRGMSSRVIANWIKETWGTDVKPQAILKWKSKQRQRRP